MSTTARTPDAHTAAAIRARLSELGAERERLEAQQRRTRADSAAAARAAYAAGMSELEIGRLTGAARMTVRKWLGK